MADGFLLTLRWEQEYVNLNLQAVMYKYYFPICPVDGPIDPPIPFAHLGSNGAVPQKCSHCSHLFEGGCTRYSNDVGHYFHLDHGPCGIDGPTDPVPYVSVHHSDSRHSELIEVPRKCLHCRFLKFDYIYQAHCTKDSDKWGDFHRGLDWGDWEPDVIYVELPPPKRTTTALMKASANGDLLSFIREYRRINPAISLRVAQEDYEYIRKALTDKANP